MSPCCGGFSSFFSFQRRIKRIKKWGTKHSIPELREILHPYPNIQNYVDICFVPGPCWAWSWPRHIYFLIFWFTIWITSLLYIAFLVTVYRRHLDLVLLNILEGIEPKRWMRTIISLNTRSHQHIYLLRNSKLSKN